MGRIAFVFSGQGAQHPGMGKSFYDANEKVRNLFSYADSRRIGTTAQCFESDAETLKKTENTQPCLYIADIAAAIATKDAGIKPDAVAGFSLGEIPALAFAGAFSPEEGFDVAMVRGQLMGKQTAETSASMMAVVKLTDQVVEELCSGYEHIYPVNYNSPGQLVVAGLTDELDKFKDDVKTAGGRAIPLAVSGAFHSPFMDAAAAGFGEYLDGVDINVPQITVYSNYTAKPYGSDIKDTLKNQMNHPVRWTDIIKRMTEDGFDTFIETGVGNVLVNLIKKTAPGCRAFAVNSMDDIETVKKELCL